MWLSLFLIQVKCSALLWVTHLYSVLQEPQLESSIRSRVHLVVYPVGGALSLVEPDSNAIK
jgi:hypothetical protein